jgi:predicted TIM-barrel fold metal-dependent hydrolase
METPEWLASFADARIRDRLEPLGLAGAGADADAVFSALPGLRERQREEPVPSDVLAGKKGWHAPGSLDGEVRSRVLDALSIEAQLVFPTFALNQFSRSRDLDLLYGGTDALNRAMAATCEHDPRLLPVGFLPLNDPGEALAALDRALALGVAALWIPSDVAGTTAPNHVDLEPVWARLAEARVPFVLHVGGGKLLPKAYHDNGRPRPKDWLGGGENLRSKDFPVLHHSPERFLACLVLDGVFDRHRDLRAGVIELGASWVPGMLANLDHAYGSFSRHEPMLQSLELTPSQYVRRQVRFTPFPFEDTAWLLEQCGPELLMFSTDYPHPEGGRHPFERFHDAASGSTAETQDRFFWRNGAELFARS